MLQGDKRTGQSWSKRQFWKNEIVWRATNCLLALARALPRSWLPPLGRGIGWLAHAILRRARLQADENLALCFPHLEASDRAELVARNFKTLGENLADTVALLDPGEPAERTLTLPATSSSNLQSALAMGRGVVFVTGHLGPWERMAAVLAAHGFPITTVARESYDPRFNRLYERLRRPRGVEAFYRGSPGSPLAIVRALRNHRVVGFPMDLPGRVPTLPVELLGQPSKLPLGPARIALRTGAVVVVGTPSPRDDGELEIRIERLSSEPHEDGPEAEAALTQRIADALSERIRALPAHWPWMHPSFRGSRVARRCDRAPTDDRLAPRTLPHEEPN